MGHEQGAPSVVVLAVDGAAVVFDAVEFKGEALATEQRVDVVDAAPHLTAHVAVPARDGEPAEEVVQFRFAA